MAWKETFNRMLGAVTGYRFHRVRARKRERLPLIRSYAERLLYFGRMFELIQEVPGAVVECGVYRGKTLLLLSYLAGKRPVYGFDSFKGFTGTYPQHFRGMSADFARWILKKGDCQTRAEIVEGFFHDTLPHFREPIALLHIDADLYDSHMTIFTCLYPLVQKGGVILFDEYKTEEDLRDWPGAARAIDEFFANKPEEIRFDAQAKKYYTVKV